MVDSLGAHLSIACVDCNTAASLEEMACHSVISPSGLYTWTETGVYMDTLTNEAGCDSIITIDLTIPLIDITVDALENELTANDASATYQWLDCDADYAIIDGKTDQIFIAMQMETMLLN